jgi:hypothetical protein
MCGVPEGVHLLQWSVRVCTWGTDHLQRRCEERPGNRRGLWRQLRKQLFGEQFTELGKQPVGEWGTGMLCWSAVLHHTSLYRCTMLARSSTVDGPRFRVSNGSLISSGSGQLERCQLCTSPNFHKPHDPRCLFVCVSCTHTVCDGQTMVPIMVGAGGGVVVLAVVVAVMVKRHWRADGMCGTNKTTLAHNASRRGRSYTHGDDYHAVAYKSPIAAQLITFLHH